MKSMTVGEKMRRVAGVLYIALAVYQMFTTQVCLYYNVTEVQFVNVLPLASAPCAAAMAIWMFGGKKALGAGARHGVVIGTALAVAYQLMTYHYQTVIIDFSLAWLLPNVFIAGEGGIKVYFFMIFRMLLLILAAFFVTSSREGTRDARDFRAGAAPMPDPERIAK